MLSQVPEVTEEQQEARDLRGQQSGLRFFSVLVDCSFTCPLAKLPSSQSAKVIESLAICLRLSLLTHKNGGSYIVYF